MQINIDVREKLCDSIGLNDHWARLAASSKEGAILATAIPQSKTRQATVGNTFVLLHLRSELVLVDSHQHVVGGEPKKAGTTIARAKPETMIQWIFKPDGFLEEMNCHRDFVAVTTFWISERSLAAWARERRGSQPGSQPRPKRSSSTPAAQVASRGSAASSSAPKPQASTPVVQPAAPKQGSSAPAVQAASRGSAASSAAAAVSPASQPKPQASTPAVQLAAPKQGSSTPAAQAASRGSQPEVRIAPMQIAGSDEHTHTSFVPGCARCVWEKNRQSWQKSLAFKDPKSGQMVTPIIVKPVHLGGAWAIGCCVCANYVSTAPRLSPGARTNAFAKFTVSNANTVRKHELERHCSSALHMEAMRAMSSQQGQRPSIGSAIAPMPVQKQLPMGSQPRTESEAQVLEGCFVNQQGVGLVPRAERFVWAIQTCQRSGSFSDYAAWSATVDLTSYLSSEGNCRDSTRHAGVKMLRCVGAVVREDHRALLKKAARMAFAIDDRDQCFLMRGRLVIPQPEVQCMEFIAGIVRDYGYTAENSADAAWACLRKLCFVQTGEKGASQPTASGAQRQPTDSGSQPASETKERGPDVGYVDKQLLQHLQEICFAGASDGCAVAVKSIQMLKDKNRLPNLRYQFRDRPHTTRTVMKGILKYMGGSQELVQHLITGKNSFCKRAKYSRRFQAIWTRKQIAELARQKTAGSQPAGSQPEIGGDLFVALQHLGYTEYRFDSRSEPMSILCSRFGAVVEVLVEMSEDKLHREDRAWAIAVLAILRGQAGFRRLIIFAMDSEFAVVTTLLVRLQDASQADVALTLPQMTETLEICEALFLEGRCLRLDRTNATYSSILLRSLSRLSAKASAALGWPSGVKFDSADLAGAKEYGKTLYKMTKDFMLLHFPHYSWRNKFGAFNCGKGTYPEKLRLKYFAELAVKEYGLRTDSPDAEKLRLTAKAEFATALVHMPRLYKESGDNRLAWSRYLDSVRQNRGSNKMVFRSNATILSRVTLTYLGVLDGTSDVERAFARLDLLESSRRERHLDENAVEDSMHVTLEVVVLASVSALLTPSQCQPLASP